MSDTRQYTVWPDPRSRSTGQGHQKFKVYCLCQYVCNKKTNGESWYSKTISKF